MKISLYADCYVDFLIILTSIVLVLSIFCLRQWYCRLQPWRFMGLPW